MVTSVTIDEDTKNRLERLQAEIRLRTGRRVTLQEVLARLVDRGVESAEDVIDSFRTTRVPVSEAERATFHEGMVSSGVRTTEEDVDDVRYG